MLEQGGLDELESAEAVTDVLYAFGTAEIDDFDFEQVERFQRRRLESECS